MSGCRIMEAQKKGEGMNKGGKGGSARAYDTVLFEIKHQKAQVHPLVC